MNEGAIADLHKRVAALEQNALYERMFAAALTGMLAHGKGLGGTPHYICEEAGDIARAAVRHLEAQK